MATYSFAGIEVKYNHSDEVLKALKNAKERGLASCGEKAVKYAQNLVPVKTGNLKGSITYKVQDNACYIGTDVKYGKYIEYGTGQDAENGDGRQTPWRYKDKNGAWHQTNGYKPRPFIRPAASEHTDEYLNILKDSLKKA